jgi:hypothetical protein
MSAALAARLPFAGSPGEAIARLASAMNQIGGLELEPVHHFAAGLYGRELTMPAGSLVVSHIHRTPHLCTCSKGRITVFQTDGAGTRTIEAPFTFVSSPGQRVGFAHEETVWTTYHPTDERDLERIEAMLYDKREFPPYVEGDAEHLLEWLGQLPQLMEARL